MLQDSDKHDAPARITPFVRQYPGRQCLALFTLLWTAGCRPMTGPPAPETASPELHLSYFTWRGTSAGAGFIRTATTSIEVDLSLGRMQRVERSTKATQGMHPPRGGAASGGVTLKDSAPLSSAKVKELTDLVEAWLATDPPCVYNRIGGLGREDGFVERLAVRRGDCTYTTSVNPRREALPGDPLRPPPEWYLLITAIRTIPSDSARAVEEAPSPRSTPPPWRQP